MVRNMRPAASECQRRQAAQFQTVTTCRRHRICDPSVDAAVRDRLRSLSCSDATRIVRGQHLETEMPTGTVKWFNPTKGYGFIQPSGGGGKDVFVHISAVERAGLRTLNDGQTVEYEIESNRGRESATNLRVK